MLFKKIKFAHDQEYETSIVPAKSSIPEWYKKSPLYQNKNNPRVTYKGCMPFLDAMTLGYVLTLPVDLKVSKTESGHYVEWAYSGKINPVELREATMVRGLPIPAGYSKHAWAFYFPTTILAPRGYSLLITHPINRTDLPFLVSTGVVDSDKVQLSFGKLPFFLDENFEGIIKAGTPYAQLIPIKRQRFKLVYAKGLIDSAKRLSIKSQSVFSGWYKKNVRVAKDYLGF